MAALVPMLLICDEPGCHFSMDSVAEIKFTSPVRTVETVMLDGWQVKVDGKCICPICIAKQKDPNCGLKEVPRAPFFNPAYYRCEGCGKFGSGRVEPGPRMGVCMPDGWQVIRSQVDPQAQPRLMCVECSKAPPAAEKSSLILHY